MYNISGLMKAPYYLFKYNDNWSDEINVDGHFLVSHFKLSIFLDAIEIFKEGEFYIGTNEAIYYDNKDEVYKRIEIIPLWERQEIILRDLGIESVGFAESFFEFVKEATFNEDEDDGYEEDENPECVKCEYKNNCRIDICPITE